MNQKRKFKLTYNEYCSNKDKIIEFQKQGILINSEEEYRELLSENETFENSLHGKRILFIVNLKNALKLKNKELKETREKIEDMERLLASLKFHKSRLISIIEELEEDKNKQMKDWGLNDE